MIFSFEDLVSRSRERLARHYSPGSRFPERDIQPVAEANVNQISCAVNETGF
jgi:hypothetical protein